MSVLGYTIPLWVFDWSGSIMVAMSLFYLWKIRSAYWHWSNASLLPYFLLFLSTHNLMLAGLQVSYLIFGIHGLLLWRLERQRLTDGVRFAQGPWYAAGWLLSLAIFFYTVAVTDFSNGWVWLQFFIVTFSLIANMATTRTWMWSWYLWIAINCLQALYFGHAHLWGQFTLQFFLGAMSVSGLRKWRTVQRFNERAVT